MCCSFPVPLRFGHLVPHEHTAFANPTNNKNALGTCIVIQSTFGFHITLVQTFTQSPVSTVCTSLRCTGARFSRKKRLKEFSINGSVHIGMPPGGRPPVILACKGKSILNILPCEYRLLPQLAKIDAMCMQGPRDGAFRDFNAST